MAETLRDIATINTQPLGEPLDELPVETPVQPEEEPTLFEQAFWDADDEAISVAWDALVDPRTGMVPYERRDQLLEFDHNVTAHNRLRVKEIALQIGTLMEAVSLLIQAQQARQAHEAKPARKRTAKVPKAALPDEPDAPDAA